MIELFKWRRRGSNGGKVRNVPGREMLVPFWRFVVAVSSAGSFGCSIQAQELIDACSAGSVVVHNIRLPQVVDEMAIRGQIAAEILSLERSFPLVVVKAAANADRLGMAFGAPYVGSKAAEDARQFIAMRRAGLASDSFGWAVSWNRQRRVGVWTKGKVSWDGPLANLIPNARLVDVVCTNRSPAMLQIYLEDDGLSVAAALAFFSKLAKELKVDPRALWVNFSRDGSFWPDEGFAEQNPLLFRTPSVKKKVARRGVIVCSGVIQVGCVNH